MPTPTEGGLANGHLSPEDASVSPASSERGQSEGLPLDVQSPHAEPSSPSTARDPGRDVSNDLHEDHDMSGTDGASSGGDASDDADFEMQDSAVSPRDDGVVPDRETSVDSPRPSKRKSPVAEEDFIKANPELYGLRRSVR